MKTIILAFFIIAVLTDTYAQTSNNTLSGTTPSPAVPDTSSNTILKPNNVPNSITPNNALPDNPANNDPSPSYKTVPDLDLNKLPDNRNTPANPTPVNPVDPMPTDPNKDRDQLMIK